MINLKQVDRSDFNFLFNLRNEDEVKKYFFAEKPVSLEEHELWFERQLENSDSCHNFLIERAGLRVGNVRFQKIEDDIIEVSIAILPEMRGQNIGLQALRKGCKLILDIKPSTQIVAYIKNSNQSSIQLFKNIGFQIQSRNTDRTVFTFGGRRQITENCSIEPVVGSRMQCQQLYKILKRKTFNISHKTVPTFEKHCEFVINNPYRVWFLVFVKNDAMGQCYLTHQNTIGLNIPDPFLEWIPIVLSYIRENFEPTSPSASIIPDSFVVNVHPENEHLKNALQTYGMSCIQHTYSLASRSS